MAADHLGSLLLESFGLHKDRLAIVSSSFQCTYEDLHKQATEISNVLLREGLQKNEPVIVVTENMPENLIGIVAVFKFIIV